MILFLSLQKGKQGKIGNSMKDFKNLKAPERIFKNYFACKSPLGTKVTKYQREVEFLFPEQI